MAVENPAFAFHHRHLVDFGQHRLRNFERNHVPDLHAEQLIEGQFHVPEIDDEFDLGALHLLREEPPPSLVGVHVLTLLAVVEQFADRFQHRVRHADVELAAGRAEFDVESGDDHHFVRQRDAGELRIHFAAHEFEFQRMHRRP